MTDHHTIEVPEPMLAPLLNVVHIIGAASPGRRSEAATWLGFYSGVAAANVELFGGEPGITADLLAALGQMVEVA